MIFVTVGSMMPFDRLISSMDAWARAHSDRDVFAQIGRGDYLPSYMRWARMVSPSEFRDAVREATITVAHAGMGSFFVAMEMQKSIVMLPRIAANGEHTTDHQLHTLQWLREKPGVFAAMAEGELALTIERALGSTNIASANFDTFAPKPFLTKIRRFLTD